MTKVNSVVSHIEKGKKENVEREEKGNLAEEARSHFLERECLPSL